jgi:succinate dehydrogenase/fumarate reductase flavoprotein subunit
MTGRAEKLSATAGSIEYDADVLVLGGGPAGTWAAISAAEHGARVVLADKGFCGTSGATAAAGTGVWYIDPDPALREAAMAGREKMGGYLQDRRWMARTLDCTYAQSNRLADWGYPYPVDGAGKSQRNSLQGPEYRGLGHVFRQLGRAGGGRLCATGRLGAERTSVARRHGRTSRACRPAFRAGATGARDPGRSLSL